MYLNLKEHSFFLQNMLKFHHSRMEGRRINVEVTCGGGGKGVTRMRKIKERNEKLRERQALKKKKQSPQK